MNSTVLNQAIASLHEALAWALASAWSLIAWAEPLQQLCIVSLTFGLLMVVIFGKLSNQRAIRRVKTEIAAALMEVFLFRRDMLQALRAQGALLWAGCRYFTLALIPVLLLALPCAVALGHLNLRFGARPLLADEDAVLSVQLTKGADLRSLTLQANPGVEVVGPVRIPKSSSAHWRIRSQINSTGEGPQKLSISVPSLNGALEQRLEGVREEMQESMQGGAVPVGIYLARYEPLTSLFFPNGGGGFSLPPGPIERIELSYPERLYAFAGVEFSWVSLFLLLSIGAGLVGARIFRISV